MPELADVDGWRRHFQRYATGHRVDRIDVRDHDVLHDTSPQGLGRALRGVELPSPERRGKWLLAPLGRSTLIFHFGMTGELHFTGADWTPHDHDRVVFRLDHGTLAYRTQRKFGGVWLTHNPDSVIGPLGPDAASVSRSEFLERLDGRRGALKSTLMNQEIVAGLGNELADEILFQAGLDPRRPLADLDEGGREQLYGTMRDVLGTALRHGRNPSLEGWITSRRGDEGADCPTGCGGSVRKETIAGRTSYWCPRCQNGK